MKNQLTLVPFLLLLITLPLFLSANELYPISLPQRVRHSSLIAEGKVIGQSAFTDALGNIYTANRIQVYRLFKGTLRGQEIEVITHGGVLGERMDVYSSYLQLSPGQSGIFFCMPATVKPTARVAGSHPAFMVYSSMQGLINYDTKSLRAADPFKEYTSIEAAIADVRQLTHQDVKLHANPDLVVKEVATLGVAAVPTITALSPTTITAGTGSVLTITGTNFGTTPGTVEFRDANTGGSTWITANSFDIVSWTDGEIRVLVPSNGTTGRPAGSGQVRVTNADPNTVTSTGSITIPYAYININYSGATYGATHVNTNGSGGYTFSMENSFAATAANTSFKRAMTTWTCHTGMNWTLGANTTVNVAADDNINLVTFDNAAPLGAGILGVCLSRYQGCVSGGVIKWYVKELDVTFSSTANWEYGPAAPVNPRIDFESVAVHELGHGQQLTHIINWGAVMHYGIAAGNQARTLSAGDINGGNLITTAGFTTTTCSRPVLQPGTVYSLAGTQGGSQVCVSTTVAAGGTTYADSYCNAIARVVPSGATPVSGSISACVKYESGIPTFNSQPFSERHVDLSPASGGSTATATITLYYSQAEFTAYNADNGAFPDLPTGAADATGIANLRVSQYKGMSATNLPGSYSGSTTVIDPSDADISWNATADRWEVTFSVNGFSGFYVHTSASTTLPIRLVQFGGSIQPERNLLQWTVSGNQAVANFEVQRSTDGMRFSTIGQLKAVGDAATDQSYQYPDDISKTANATLYYRLRLIGNDGKESHSQVITLKRGNSAFVVTTLQNPFAGQLQVSIHSPRVQKADLLLTDMNGRILLRQPVSLLNGHRILDIAAAQSISSGTYLLTIATPTERRVLKVVKQ